MRNKQVVLLIAGISGVATGIIVSLNIPFIRQGLFYPASPVEIVVSLCLTFSGLLLWHGMHAFFSAGIDSWKADPELNNLIYMWNILMYAIPYTLYALAAGFLVTSFLSPMYELIFGNIMIFLLKRRMRRENTLREGSNNASH